MAESRTKRRYRRRARMDLVALAALFCLTAGLVFAVSGCGEDMRKAALTEEEIRDLTYASKLTRPDELLVSGERITCQDVMARTPDEMDMEAPFKEKLEQLAAAMSLDQFTEGARPVLARRLNSNITNIVLYKRAQRQLGDQIDERLEELAESELRKFVLDHGGNNAQADEALKAIGMNRVTFKERKKKEALAEYLMASKTSRNRPIAYREIAAKYDELKYAYFSTPAMLQFRLIDIKAEEIELTDPNDDPIKKARALADSLVSRICAGEDFAALAEQYSHGHRAAMGGLWEPRDPEGMAEPYDVLVQWAQKINVDEIAGPIPADTPGRFFIMKLVDRKPKGYLPLPDVQDQVEQRIRFDRRLEDLKELEDEIGSEVRAADTDGFVDYCLEQLHAVVNASSAATDEPAP